MERTTRSSLVHSAIAPEASIPSRAALLAGLAGLSGALLYAHLPGQLGELPYWTFAGGLYAGMIGAVAVFIYRFMPRFGLFLELATVSRLILSIVAGMSPDFAVLLVASPMLNATLVVLLASGLRWQFPPASILSTG